MVRVLSQRRQDSEWPTQPWRHFNVVLLDKNGVQVPFSIRNVVAVGRPQAPHGSAKPYCNRTSKLLSSLCYSVHIPMNATASDHQPSDLSHISLLWSYLIILSFLRLLRLDPLVLHILSVAWKLLPSSSAAPAAIEVTERLRFQA